jgi:sugar phosphate isomerase/epimerase
MPFDATRRSLLLKGGALVAAGNLVGLTDSAFAAAPNEKRVPGFQTRLSLNAYSFNQPLRDGSMTLFDVVDFCAQHGVSGLDATGYYFPGYPAVPPDEYLYDLKRHAFVNGVTVHGTGVRNDFAVTNAAARAADIQLVKNWVLVASKLGASIVRVFTGRQVPEGHRFEQVLRWMVPALKECTAFAKAHGVILGLQNHHDFVKTAAETIQVVEAVDSPWLRVILDVGSLRQRNVYDEVKQLLPYAVSWQLKEKVWFGDEQRDIDLARLRQVVEAGGFRGFMPIETLGPGDPRQKVARFLEQVKPVFG